MNSAHEDQVVHKEWQLSEWDTLNWVYMLTNTKLSDMNFRHQNLRKHELLPLSAEGLSKAEELSR